MGTTRMARLGGRVWSEVKARRATSREGAQMRAILILHRTTLSPNGTVLCQPRASPWDTATSSDVKSQRDGPIVREPVWLPAWNRPEGTASSGPTGRPRPMAWA